MEIFVGKSAKQWREKDPRNLEMKQPPPMVSNVSLGSIKPRPQALTL